MRALILLLALTGCATCEQKADKADGYTGDPIYNILYRDNLIRECEGMEPRPIPQQPPQEKP